VNFQRGRKTEREREKERERERATRNFKEEEGKKKT